MNEDVPGLSPPRRRHCHGSVADGHFAHHGSDKIRFRQDFDMSERPIRLNRDTAKHRAAKEAEFALDIVELYSQKNPDQQIAGVVPPAKPGWPWLQRQSEQHPDQAAPGESQDTEKQRHFAADAMPGHK